MEARREFIISSEVGTQAHLIMSLSRFNNVNLHISVDSPTFKCTNIMLQRRINRRTGSLSSSTWKESKTVQFPYVIPETHRDEVCDALDEMKKLAKQLKAQAREAAQ